MCIAIYKPQGIKISKASLERCFNANPDGAGFMFAEKKKLHTHKGFFTFKEFYDNYKQHQMKQALVHFRIKTHGKTDKENCHPFLVNKGLGFIHNGIISGYGDDKLSDTIQFNDAILKKIVARHGNMALFDDPTQELIENVIGYSKLVFLDRHGEFNIMNEDKGHWHNKVWYSNSSYKKPEPIVNNGWRGNQYYKQWQKPMPTSIAMPTVGEWVETQRDITVGTGDNTHIIKEKEWLEVHSIEGSTCSLISSDIRNPLIFSGINPKDIMTIDELSDEADVNSWNKSFSF